MKVCVLLLVALCVSNAQLATYGSYLANFVTGSCLALQKDQTDTTTDCYKACAVTAQNIVKISDATYYTNGAYNLGDFYNKLNVLSIKFNTQFSECNYYDFMLMVDNRMSDLSFVSGSAVNMIVQAFFQDSGLRKMFTELGSANGDYQVIGKAIQGFLSQLMSFEAPRIKEKPTTY